MAVINGYYRPGDKFTGHDKQPHTVCDVDPKDKVGWPSIGRVDDYNGVVWYRKENGQLDGWYLTLARVYLK